MHIKLTNIIKYNILVLLFLCFNTILGQTEQLHDPTIPIGTNLSDIAGIKIDGIIIANNRKIVSIDGRQLVEGDKIRGAVITDIQPDRVIFKDESGSFTVFMAGAKMKTAPANTISKNK